MLDWNSIKTITSQNCNECKFKMPQFKMIKKIKKVINYLSAKPKILFLIDGLGAMLTAFLLFVILRNFNEYFGMPKIRLTYLSAIAACFCIYSSACFIFLKDNWTLYLRGIGIANLLYCILTMGFLIIYYFQITMTGATYFLLEIAIICGLVYIELNVATIISKSRIE